MHTSDLENKGLAVEHHLPWIVFVNVAAIFVGVLLGACLQTLPSYVPTFLSALAWIPVAMIKGLASPLLFLAIVQGLMADSLEHKNVRFMFFVCLVNAFAGVIIALTIVNVSRAGVALAPTVLGVMQGHAAQVSQPAAAIKTITWMDALKNLTPDSLVAPFVQNNVPAILILALLFGVAIRRSGRTGDKWDSWFLSLRSTIDLALSVVGRAMGIVLKTMPFAILAAVARAVGEHGFGVFRGLSWYVVVCVGGMLLQICIVYQAWIVFRARRSLRVFWRLAKLPVVYAFGANSSLSALPSTLNALDDLKCSQGSSRLGACVGTNFNNDGILLYEVAAVVMLAQAAGLDWSLGHQILVAGICVVATLGVSGFPEAGIIALSLVLTSAGLPMELLPLLLPVDWLVARARSATNVLGDMTVSLAIDGATRQV